MGQSGYEEDRGRSKAISIVPDTRDKGTKRERSLSCTRSDTKDDKLPPRPVSSVKPSTCLYLRRLPSSIDIQKVDEFFRQVPGYTPGSARLTVNRTNQTIGFLDFATLDTAESCLHRYNGITLPHTDATLDIEFAKQTMRKPNATQDVADTRLGPTATASVGETESNVVFVGAMPDDSTAREISHIFRPFPGYYDVVLGPRLARSGQRTAFVSFESIEQARYAVSTTQGYRIAADDPTPLKIDFSRQPMPKPGEFE
eukprot:GHVR01150771.1.p1 GENE.GHVR01150771.1~~GHVR01150771.1.p1  ORF type:complete len:256 (+),score=40.95 GHVR01150771.1:67-834(+)